MYSNLKEWLEAKRNQQTHRQLVVIAGDEDWAIKRADEIAQYLEYKHCLSVGTSTETLATNTNYRQYLGQEFDCLIYNAFRGFRANAVMALSGTIKASGLTLLICPNLEQWPDFDDPERIKRTSYGFDTEGTTSYFIQWLVNHIESTKDCAILTETGFSGSIATNSNDFSSLANDEATPDQQHAIQCITKVVTGHRRRPLVISADRGRGKSSALGMAAAELLKDRCRKILVTAPNVKACEQTFYHAQKLLPGSVRDKTALTLEGKQLQFLPPDALLKTKPEADLLLIDEAAAIPTPLLKKLLAQYSRVVFSTTVHGYEGSGRGFEIRFKKHLDNNTPNWQQVHLSDPIRWSRGDPLEAFWFDALLMKEETSQDSIDEAKPSIQELRFNRLSGKDLVEQPEQLSALFSLMVNAHYQTVPDDLQRLLDSPDHHVLTATYEGHIVGAILFVSEPAYLKVLTSDIQQGKRRVNGHLLSQSLCFHAGFQQATELTYYRTVRIAVNPLYQGLGIGSELLQQLQNIAQEQQVDMLGTSFGLEDTLLQFWQRNDYQLIRIGYQKDASSGEYSGLMMCPLSPKATKLCQQVKQAYSNEFTYQLPNRFNDLPCSLVQMGLEHLEYSGVSEGALLHLKQFSRGERPLELVEHLLFEFLLFSFSKAQYLQKDLSDIERETLVRYCLQRQSLETVCTHTGLTGKKQLKATLMSGVSKLL